jgi:hypothetical protein
MITPIHVAAESELLDGRHCSRALSRPTIAQGWRWGADRLGVAGDGGAWWQSGAKFAEAKDQENDAGSSSGPGFQ